MRTFDNMEAKQMLMKGDFVADFLNTHLITQVSDYSLELIPMRADGTYGLALPIPFYECIISPNDERELMKLYIKTRSDQVYDILAVSLRCLHILQFCFLRI